MKTVLVLGAAGSVGRAVATAFVAHGWQVLGLVRAGRAGDLPQGVQPVAADLYAPAAVAAACEAAAPGGVDIVFNGLNLPYSRWAAEASGLYGAALDVAGALGARHIYPGNIYVFGAGMPAQLRTDTPFRPTTRKGKIRVDIEAGMRQAAEAGRVRSLVIRAGDFFGAASKTSWMELLVAKNLARGELTGVGPRDTVHAWAYLPDLAETIVRLSE
ncbi:MAG: NAD-dependent epimerase/dehydratase family protein, partial [Asticcacaulis sp.]